MPNANKPLRQSVSLSPRVARRVRALARLKKASASRVIAELIKSGLEARTRNENDSFSLRTA
jgi:DNA-binding MarR family transcriptional regulator